MNVRRAIHLNAMLDYFALLIVFLIWHGQSVQTAAGWLTLILLLLPLLLPFPGLMKGSRYTFKWTSLILTPYIGYTLMEAVAIPAVRLWTTLALVMAFMLIVSLVLYLRVSVEA